MSKHYASLYGWLARFVGGAPSEEVQKAAIGLGLLPGHVYSPIGCEVCGNGLETEYSMAPRAQASIALGNSETLHILLVGEEGVILRNDTPLCRGESVWLARGQKNFAGCTCEY